MNITFMIGNGFDRNLGLSTTYSEFVEYYKTLKGKSAAIQSFQKHMDENELLWSNAELALGEYTGELQTGEGAIFSECQEDFCEELAKYLIREEKRIDFSGVDSKVKLSLKKVESLETDLMPTDRSVISDLLKAKSGEEWTYNFINFNYTRTLDVFLSAIGSKKIGEHIYYGKRLNNSIGQICHVHGTVEKDMVFAVAGKHQISKPDIFDCPYGDIYRSALIKKESNASYRADTDRLAYQLLMNSQIIYIYGMSLGETDELWWFRVCTWLSNDSSRQLIIRRGSAPDRGVRSTAFQVFEHDERNRFMDFSDLNESKRKEIASRIHIVKNNIFESISNIASPIEENISCQEIEELLAAI